MADQGKMILVFCDGTAFDGTMADEKINPNNVAGDVGDDPSLIDHQWATNVLRLSRAVLPKTTKDRRQLVFYQSGVGSESDFAGKHVKGTWDIQSMGLAIASKIRDAYAFIAQNYEEHDELCIFGFSRGGYTARKLAQLIDTIGLLQTQSLGVFFTIWRALVEKKPYILPPKTRNIRIRCVGVWDTVGSIVETINALNLKDTDLPKSVDCALHALSFHENEFLILPTLWTVPKQGLSTTADGTTQVFKQIWFPGAHMDVGGGFERHELADLALFWMAGEISEFIALDLDFLRRSGQDKPEPWGTSQPANAYESLNQKMREIFGHETRLEGGQITPDLMLHSSILVSPAQLKQPKYMITLDTLRQRFGPNWPMQISALNEFEVLCKKLWGTTPADVPTHDGQTSKPEPPPVFESPSDLFGKRVD